MSSEKIEKNTHKFWMETCGIDTYRRSPQHARHDTPWNAFSEDDILVCTLWRDQIVTVFDPQEDRTRKFVKLGGKMRTWKGPAVAHGEEADRNLRRASAERLRVVGYEAEPDQAVLKKGDRKVAFFYMDRAHELKRIFELSGQEVVDRLELRKAFRSTRQNYEKEAIDPGYLFELIAPRGKFPGSAEVTRFPSDRDEEAVDDEGDLFDGAENEASTTQDYALRTVRILIDHVLNQRDYVLQPLTYKQLAERLNRRNKNGIIWARGLGYVLGRVTSLIDQFEAEWVEPVPFLTTIVVSSQGVDKGLPGVGIKGRWLGYEKLTRAEKEAKLMAEYERILNFGSRWNDVLTHLGLPALLPPESSHSVGADAGGWGGGESEEHKALKLFIKANPQLVGADSDWMASEEYALRSGDEIDVFFKSSRRWIGAEVKSSVSDGLEQDYQRGLYQVIKYEAVLRAQAAIDSPHDPPAVQVFLVLESELPAKYRDVAKSLGVAVLEKIKPLLSAPDGNIETGGC